MVQYKRNCPQCNKVLEYASKYGCSYALSKNSLCCSCTVKNLNWVGEKNPFYGKKHSKATKEKISKNRDVSFTQTDSYKKKMSALSSGSNNAMYGKTVYEVWVKKYGEIRANELMESFKEKQRKNSSGSNNPMYGKPTPQGAGNGWSGWYKNIFFRSLRELSYMIYLDESDSNWESAERIKIKYVNWDGKERTYSPDFLVNKKYLIEIKPIKLHKSKIVKLKKEAACKYCEENNLIYQLKDHALLSDREIALLRKSGVIKFTERYENLFVEKYIKHDNIDA